MMIIFCYPQCLTDAGTTYHILGSLITRLSLTLCGPMNCRPSGSSVYGVPRQESWGGLPSSSPQDLPRPVIEPASPALQVGSLPYELPGEPSVVL